MPLWSFTDARYTVQLARYESRYESLFVYSYRLCFNEAFCHSLDGNMKLPSDAGYLFQHAWAPATLHRRRNTAEMGDSGEHNAVPPPSYQASTLLHNAGSIEGGSLISGEGGSSAGSSKNRIDAS